MVASDSAGGETPTDFQVKTDGARATCIFWADDEDETMKPIPAIWTGLLAVALAGCAKGTDNDFGAFGNTVGMAAGDGTGADGDGGGDDKPEDDNPGSGPVDGDGGDGAPPPDDGGGAAGDCCAGHGGLGCADAVVAACVCAQDPFCCDNAWDGACVDLVGELGCGMCGVGDDGGGNVDGGGMGDSGGAVGDTGGAPPPPPPGGNVGDCCAANNSVGCDDAAVESCVCNVDSYCCDTDWDSICVGLVDSEGCGQCGGGAGGTTGMGSGGTTGMGGGGAGDCCAPNGSPGCDDPSVQTCVCAVDAFCCDSEWDQICADLVDGEACGDCGGGATSGGGMGSGGGPSPCCVPLGVPGCGADPAVEACVCAGDAFCCDSEWDQLCADAVEGDLCGSCS